ncbi:MAG: class I SAM-dependent rRNA methyltransferase [Calditrichaeota bacterium]|nr:MAG: class I SAM-dependent rRNA methyltransferase [Calditrichota bacterium]
MNSDELFYPPGIGDAAMHKDLENRNARAIIKGEKLRSLRNRHPWIFSGAVERIEGEFQSGDILSVYAPDGRFLAKGFVNLHSQIRIRALTFREETITPDFFRRRMAEAMSFRRTFVPPQTTAYRLIHSDGDLLPGLIVDRYADVLVVQFNSLGIARLRPLVIEWLVETLRPRAIVERSEARILSEEGLEQVRQVLYGEAPAEVEILEHGVKFVVDVVEGQKTGFFLDQRENRRMIGELAAGKRLLNCFSYSAGFSVYAALRGAITTSVDISEPAIEMARRNFEINGLEVSRHRFVVANVFEYLREMEEPYDVIILDPPAFVKQRKHVARGAQGYKDINRLAILNSIIGGLILTCSCSAHVSWDLFQKIIFSAAREAGRNVQILGKQSQPVDHPINVYHPEGEYLKSMLLRVLD